MVGGLVAGLVLGEYAGELEGVSVWTVEETF